MPLLFFDIDGTLVSFNTHTIPQSTIDALHKAKARGCRVIIATGRPPLLINNLSPIADIIDGFLTTNGAYCFVGDTMVCCEAIPEADVHAMLDDAQVKGYSVLLVGKDDIFIFNEQDDIINTFHEKLGIPDLHSTTSLDTLLSQPILQLTPFFSIDDEKHVMEKMPGSIAARWYPTFADITSRKAGKNNGLKAMARFFNTDIADTISFGDGANDTPMIVCAGTGVAMGNANNDVKAAADLVTSSVDDDGIAKALKKLGVI